MTQPRQRAAFNRRRFTADNVFKLKPKKKQYLVWDEGGDSARGLAILVSPTGTRSFRCVFYYPGSPKAHWKHLGRVDECSEGGRPRVSFGDRLPELRLV